MKASTICLSLLFASTVNMANATECSPHPEISRTLTCVKTVTHGRRDILSLDVGCNTFKITSSGDEESDARFETGSVLVRENSFRGLRAKLFPNRGLRRYELEANLNRRGSEGPSYLITMKEGEELRREVFHCELGTN